jgi:hypothetical protein
LPAPLPPAQLLAQQPVAQMPAQRSSEPISVHLSVRPPQSLLTGSGSQAQGGATQVPVKDVGQELTTQEPKGDRAGREAPCSSRSNSTDKTPRGQQGTFKTPWSAAFYWPE